LTVFGFDLRLVAAGTRAATQDDYHVNAIFRQGHEPKVPTCLGHLGQVTSVNGWLIFVCEERVDIIPL
jgi:hypothetical protein